MSEKLGKPIWDSALNFWFHELTPKQWFVSSSQLDQTISDRFSGALQALASVQSTDDVNDDYLSSLTINSALDTLGAILITDQFSRNIYRGSAKAFATDNFALSLSNYLINHDHLPAMETQQVQFAVMPQMHAEDLEAQRLCVDLFKRFGVEQGVKFIPGTNYCLTHNTQALTGEKMREGGSVIEFANKLITGNRLWPAE